MNIDAETIKEYKRFENWFEQFGNFIYAIASCIGLWIGVSVIMTGVICMMALWTDDFTFYTVSQIQTALKELTKVVFVLSFIFIFLFNLPKKMPNVFRNNAADRVRRFNAVKEQVDSQTRIADALLLQYGLINQDDINRRIKKESR